MLRHGPSSFDGPWSHRARRGPSSSSIRYELVERIRREIAAGTYETPEKWEEALDALYERLIRDLDGA